MFDEYRLKNYNFRLVLYILCLNILGVLVISSATNNNMKFVGKQILGIIVGLILMVIFSLIPYEKMLKFSIPIYVLCIIMLTAVFRLGSSTKGARRWLELPFLGKIQPSEFVKIGLVLCVAWLLAKYIEYLNKAVFLAIVVAVLAVPYALILAQPDLSTTVVSAISIAAMIFIAGLSYRWIGGILAVSVPILVGFFALIMSGSAPFLRSYQVGRILAFLDRENHSGANYQQNTSIMAIASGKVYGKGLFTDSIASVKHGNYLAEEQTDFIFSIIGEELGFVGCMAVIGLIAFIVIEILIMANKARDMEGQLICVGLAVMIGFQSFTNIAVVTGLFPNTGIPLPFISYGVSSLLSMFICIGIILNVGLQRNIQLN